MRFLLYMTLQSPIFRRQMGEVHICFIGSRNRASAVSVLYHVPAVLSTGRAASGSVRGFCLAAQAGERKDERRADRRPPSIHPSFYGCVCVFRHGRSRIRSYLHFLTKNGGQKKFGRLILFLHIHSALCTMNIRIPIHTIHQVIHSRWPVIVAIL